ncbi:hypothetical protein [Noviherbaspirillum aerium]|uniref:hypothetical protein n=1 Tax=Noviherbaspirillum aerium TaxID=2588497 RepID=UPI00124EBA71|nr:hypothetical protein [Noviherbaspirillum aerium]
MELHQLQVSYQAEEDRLLFRASFKAEDGMLQELRAWITRRLLKALWPAIRQVLETQVRLDKPQAAHASADIVGMEHHASVKHIHDTGNFAARYENEISHFPLGEAPLLITSVNFTQDADQPVRIKLAPDGDDGFELSFIPVALHGFCSLLMEAAKTAEWDIALEMPGTLGAMDASGGSRLLN